jgi:hypothetical protein
MSKDTTNEIKLPFGLKAHPLANELPLATGKSKDILFESIKTHGFDKSRPVVLLNGQVLAGRNRLLGAEAAGLKKEDIAFREFNESTEGNPDVFVVKEDIARRNIGDGQLSLIGSRLASIIAERLKKEAAKVSDSEAPKGTGDPIGNPAPQGKSPAGSERPSHVARKQAAKQLNISEDSIKKAALVAKFKDLKEKLEKDEIKLDAAYQEAVRRRDEETNKKNETKIKEARKVAIATIAKSFGEDHQLVAAIKRGSVLSEAKELNTFVELPKATQVKISGLIVQKIPIKKAIQLLDAKITLDSTIQDFINHCILKTAGLKSGDYFIEIGGGTISWEPNKVEAPKKK